MIILDTNVVSELVKRQPDHVVAAWARRRDGIDLFTTAVTLAEMRYGHARLPDGRRKRELGARIEIAFATFAQQVVPFDTDAGLAYGPLVADREECGRPIGTADAQIAAICRARDAALATRNVTDFEGIGIEIVDPWLDRG